MEYLKIAVVAVAAVFLVKFLLARFAPGLAAAL